MAARTESASSTEEYEYPRTSARISVRLSEHELDRIDLFCDRAGTDRSTTIRQGLKEYLDRQPIMRDIKG